MEREIITADEQARAAQDPAWLARVDELWREAEALGPVTFAGTDGDARIYEVTYPGGYARVRAGDAGAAVLVKTGVNPPEDDILIRVVAW